MRGAVRNKDRWKGRRAPTQYPGTNRLLSRSEYSVLAETEEDFQHTVRFAATHNLRLVVKATGHDWYALPPIARKRVVLAPAARHFGEEATRTACAVPPPAQLLVGTRWRACMEGPAPPPHSCTTRLSHTSSMLPWRGRPRGSMLTV